MQRRKARLGSYAALLTVLLLYLVLRSALSEMAIHTGWVTSLLFPLLVLSSLLAIIEFRLPLIVLAVAVLAGILIDSLAPPGASALVDLVRLGLRVVLLFTLLGIILWHVFSSDQVTGDLILGAACAYLVVALAFSQIFALVEVVAPGSFSAEALEAPDYVSLVTLTSLGYGDLVPLRPTARMLAAIEAFFGQFYVAVIVARLVALRLTPGTPSGADEA